jgi:GNAT superfamily N-acetyltransferase
VWRIRSFLNTDPPHLAKIWNEHHAAIQSASRSSVNLWDQCILSKIYFRPEHLLLAVDENDMAMGFIHFGSGMEGTPWHAQSRKESDAEPPIGMVHALCVVPNDSEDKIAQQLIDHAVGCMRQAGHLRLMALGSLESSVFYLGIADGDNLMGVLKTDRRTHAWLEKCGFQDTTTTECWDLSLDVFRPPVDRSQIAIRRTCSIGRILEESHPNWWVSTVLGHCDQSRFHLMVHTPERTEMEILYWYPDATLRGVDSTTARLSLPYVTADETHRERLVCLISESARQLQQERKRTVRVVTTDADVSMHLLLKRLGFRWIRNGSKMELDTTRIGSYFGSTTPSIA